MKRLGCIGLGLVLCAGMLAGCSTKLQADTDTVYVTKNGKVISVDTETFDQSYYDEAELKDYVESTVESYNADYGKDAVKVQSISVEDGNAKLEMEYKTVDDYAAFNGVELYQGKIVQAMAAGYDFDADFAGVSDDGTYGVAKEDVISQEDLKVVIIKANTDVKIDGKILYVSCENVTVTGKDTVSIKKGTGIDQTWKTEAEDVSTEEPALSEDIYSTEETGETQDEEVIIGEVIIGTEQPETADTITNLSGDEYGADTYTYIIYK